MNIELIKTIFFSTLQALGVLVVLIVILSFVIKEDSDAEDLYNKDDEK